MQQIYKKENIVKNNEIISTTQIYLLIGATMKLLRVPILRSGPNLTKVIGLGLHSPNTKQVFHNVKESSRPRGTKNRAYANTFENWALVSTQAPQGRAGFS